MADKASPVGLIAGSGRLPFLVADGVRKAGSSCGARNVTTSLMRPSLWKDCSFTAYEVD